MNGILTQPRLARTVGALLVAIALAALLAPGVAHAQDAPALASLSTVLAVHGAGQPDTLIVFAEAPQGTPLPAKISVAVPKGTKPDWVGEIVGSDPSQDPTAQYTIAAGKDYDIASVTLTRGLKGQLEFTLPSKSGGTDYTLSQPIIGPVGSASLAFQVPAGSSVTGPGLTKDGTSGDTDRYSKTVTNPKVGTAVTTSATIKAAAVSQSPQTGQQPSAAQPQQGAVPQGQQGAPVGSTADSSGGFPWMTVIVLASIAFFAYNYHRWRQVKAAQVAAQAAVPHNERAAARTARVEARGKAAESAHEASDESEVADADSAPDGDGDPAVESELKALGDKRSRGELTREEYLARKRQLLGGSGNGTSAMQGI